MFWLVRLFAFANGQFVTKDASFQYNITQNVIQYCCTKGDNFIQRINPYPVDKTGSFSNQN